MGKRQQRRIETEAELVRSVGRVIARDGMDGLGVNAVAREAGVDKVLIYRYFDGLPGLLRAFGESADFWPTVGEVVDEPIAAYREHDSIPRLSRDILRAYLNAIRSRPLARKILAWEPANRNALTIELETTRRAWNLELFKRFEAERIRVTHETVVLTSLFSAALNYLTARGELKVFGGLDLETDDGWDKLFDVIERAVGGTQ